MRVDNKDSQAKRKRHLDKTALFIVETIFIGGGRGELFWPFDQLLVKVTGNTVTISIAARPNFDQCSCIFDHNIQISDKIGNH